MDTGYKAGFLGSKEASITINQALEQAQSAKLAVAYIGLKGYSEVLKPLEQFLKENKPLKMIVGISSYHITEWQALVELVKLSTKFPCFSVRYYNHEGFHPKFFYFTFSDKFWIVIGSSNLTGGGFGKNVEANVLLEIYSLDCELLKETRYFWNTIWKNAQPLTPYVIHKYKKSFPVNQAKEGNASGLPKTSLPQFSTNGFDSHYWKIAPGKQGIEWQNWKNAVKNGKGYIAIGWGAIGSLQNLQMAPRIEFFKGENKGS